MNRTTSIVALALTAASVLAGCSSDSDGATTTTRPAAKPTATAETTGNGAGAPASRAAFCAGVKAAFGDYQPGFDAIFADGNDDPTLAEWAAFLPGPTGEFDAVLTRIEAVAIPSDDQAIADSYETALNAMKTVSGNFRDSIDAANAGDQATFDQLESKNQDTDLPAMQQAMDEFGSLCGFPEN